MSTRMMKRVKPVGSTKVLLSSVAVWVAEPYFNAASEKKLSTGAMYRVKIRSSCRTIMVSDMNGEWVTTMPYIPEEWDIK